MNDYNEKNDRNINDGNVSEVNGQSDQNNSPSNDQSYNYKGDSIIQDAPNTQGGTYSQPYTAKTEQHYTYQSSAQQNNYSQPYYGTYQQNNTQRTAPVYSAQPAAAQASTMAKKGRRPVTVTTVIICMLITAIVSSTVCGIAFSSLTASKSPSSATGGNSVSTGQTTIVPSNDMTTVEAVAAVVTPSVVCIEVKSTVKSSGSYLPFFGSYGNSGESESISYGSGVIYSTDGYIITNYHVISGLYSQNVTSAKLQVYLGDDSENAIEAKVVGYNSSADLAVIKINKTGLTAVQIGDSSKLTLGQTVVAIGNPGGIEFAGSVTSGIISGLDREISVDSVTMSLIQTDAAINPGNSGGALVDSTGCLVGVPNVKISASGYEGMGFCIPVNTVVEICNDIIENGMSNNNNNSSPYLGVEINRNFTGGAYVASVTEGGPAEAAGLQSGDVIVSLGNKKVTGYESLVEALNSYHPGDKVSVGVYRNGAPSTVKVTLGSNNG